MRRPVILTLGIGMNVQHAGKTVKSPYIFQAQSHFHLFKYMKHKAPYSKHDIFLI